MANGLSFEMYMNQKVIGSKYAAKYVLHPELINRDAIKNQWVEELHNIAREGPLSQIAIDSFIANFGEKVLLNTFRGVYGKGLIGYIPSDKEDAHKKNPMMF
jgi:tyrosine-protein phosphatase YwqE